MSDKRSTDESNGEETDEAIPMPDAEAGGADETWDDAVASENDEVADDEAEPTADDAEAGDAADSEWPSEEDAEPTASGSATPVRDTEDQRKWFVIGVGGTGGNLLDGILLRRDTLEQERNWLSAVWDAGIQGYGSLNTHKTELAETYWAATIKDNDVEDYVFGPGRGAGTNDKKGQEYAEEAFRVGDPFSYWNDINLQQVQQASAVMFLHSVVNGTGSGATPTVARELNDEVFSTGEIAMMSQENPVYSAVVLPSAGESGSDGGIKKKNAAVGLARMAKHVDAIVPFENSHLKTSEMTVAVDGAEDYFRNYVRENKSLLAFLEAFSMSAIPQTGESDRKVRGNMFDVSDPIDPLDGINPLGLSPDEQPAHVLAPAYNRIRASEFTSDVLERLVAATLSYNGKLVDFDETTAWGGPFLFICPPGTVTQVRDVVERHLNDIIEDRDFLDVGDDEEILTTRNYVEVPEVEDYRLWVTLWNPEMPAMDRFHEYATDKLENGGFYSSRLEEYATDIENLFGQLGREVL